MFYSQRALSFLGGILLTIVLVWLWTTNIGKADNAGIWLSPSTLILQKQADLASVPASINGNIDCVPEQTGSCAISAPYGSANTAGAVTLNNPADYHPVVSNIDNRQHFIAIPNSNQFITYTTEPAIGFYFYFNHSFLGSVALKNEGLGAYYQVTRSPEAVLTDSDGHKLQGDYGSISFSENGEWMVISDPNVAMLRVNLQTFEVLPFAAGFNYTIGLSPDVKTAISNDGRYAAVASKNNSRFSIYDLGSCSSVPNTISGPVDCESRDLQNRMSQSVIGFNGVTSLRFLSDSTLGLYAGYLQNSINKSAKYILTSGAETINQQAYLALGDSYISGEGAFKYLPGTDSADNQCHVSQISYPLLIGQELNYNSFHSVSCSGATTDDVINQTNSYDGQIISRVQRNQYTKDQVSFILSNFQQGYIDQLDFVKQYQPKIVTISIAGNDIGFSARLRQCLELGTCYNTYEDRLEFVREVNRAFPKLVNTYTKVKNQGAVNARIYAIGYPQIAKADGNCAINVHMNHDELVFAQQAINYLDTVVKAAANRAGVFYADTEDALNGHRLCEAKSGSAAVNGITAGNDFPDKLGGPVGRESYHPNDFGHLLLDNSIRTATHDLTDPMPPADLSASPPSQNGLEILNVPKGVRTINQTEYDSVIAPDLAYNQTPLDLTITGSNHALAAATTLHAEIHSNPVGLGNVTSDSDGNVNSQITIPANVSAGFHTLHLYGTDISGQSIDIFKEIYVAVSPDDLDGNGIPDSQQMCVGVVAAGQDIDNDGVDDSCDGQIALPPAGGGQPAALTGSISSLTPNLIAFTPPSGMQSSKNSQITFSARSQTNQPKVLAASTTSSPNDPANQNLRLSPRPVLFGLGILLAISFALSLV